MKITLTRDIATCLALRRIVFIEEQGVSEADEQDDLDDQALHLLAQVDGQAAGTARLLIEGDTVKVGRVCVLPAHRGSGLGAALMRAAVAEARRIRGITTVKLGAQTHALGFYENLGFTVYGPEFDDAGIPHREMKLTL
ncbi:MAG: GNAT family N-acetyltransferase [Paracoccaceae bacterium]